jgi:gliding motility-associated-like protein
MGKILRRYHIYEILCVLLWLTGPAVAQTTPCVAPDPPAINGTATRICRGESATLTASGCDGTVIWSTGQAGAIISVSPQQTTRYTAVCQLPNRCVSCYANVWTLTIGTPDAPTLTASASQVCPGDAITLTATNCAGTVSWPDGSTGNSLTVTPSASDSYIAYCEKDGCRSNPSIPLPVAAQTPTVPVIVTEKTDVCAGQTVRLTALNCLGTVRWNDGTKGLSRDVIVWQTTYFRAVCEIGHCRSAESPLVSVSVRSGADKPALLTTVTNLCPYQTANLRQAITDSPAADQQARYVFRVADGINAPAVQSPSAVVAGTYYVFQQHSDGCFGQSVAVRVEITPCANAIAPCQSNPAVVAIRLDTLDRAKGIVCLSGQLRGSAENARWQTNGTGLFTDSTLTLARYMASEHDRQRGTVTFALTTTDPDGNGPCIGASASFSAPLSPLKSDLIGLSKHVLEPVWTNSGEVEITYRLTVSNLSTQPLQQVQVSDDLDRTFGATGARLLRVSVRADSGLTVNPAYTGRMHPGHGADTTLLLADRSRLAAGSQKSVYLTAVVDVRQAATLTFQNTAGATALDAENRPVRDQSTNGADADPDRNGSPTDNSEPTVLTLQGSPAEGETVFIPEGFSPNGDGVNDRFVIRSIPAGLTVSLTVFNRWGQAVYQQDPYRNDWDGTANAGLLPGTSARAGLPDGTYFYVVRLSDGREYAKFLTLMR